MNDENDLDLYEKFMIAILVVILLLGVGSFWESNKVEEKNRLVEVSKYKAAIAKAEHDDQNYKNSDLEALNAFYAWERNAKDVIGDVLISQGKSSKILLTTYHKSYVYGWGDEYHTRSPFLTLWGETPSGVLFKVKYNPVTKELNSFDTDITRNDVVRASIESGKRIDQTS